MAKANKAKASAAVKFTQIKGFRAVQAGIRVVVREIVKEIIDEMNLTLMAVGKSFSPGALDEWKDKLSISVFMRLMDGGDWARDRADVLAVASDMALIGSILSGSAPVVNRGRAHAAFRAVKDHATCPGPLGGGRWCDFDI